MRNNNYALTKTRKLKLVPGARAGRRAAARLTAARLLAGGLLVGSFFTGAKLAAQTVPLEIPPFRQAPERVPAYPLKSARMIWSDEEISLARQNIAQYPGARKVMDQIVQQAGKWLAWDDTAISGIMPDARVPRAFELHPEGCPKHGKEVFAGRGAYPWILDPARPFQVVCPVGGEKYPSNDYAAYYRNGLKGALPGDTGFVDDGWGWVAPNGERYWFVAYANQWTWKQFIEPGLLNLSRAYLLTGDKRYAHKAAVMLYRLAEVYPSMDYEPQSRYGLLSRAAGREYPGKVLNRIWETTFIESAAEAYDAIWDSIDEDRELQQLAGKSGREIRAFIEANVLEEALDAYFKRTIQGNFGMHQSALLHILLARQHMDTAKYLDILLNQPGPDRPHMGLRYALYNQLFRDGMPLESPQYNMIWLNRLASLGELLRKTGADLTADPRFRMLFDAPLRIVAAGRHTVDWGDSGSSTGAVQGRIPDVYQFAWQAYRDPAYLSWLAGAGLTGDKSFTGFPSLFRKILPETAPPANGRAVAPQASRLLAGYGLGILNDERDETALALSYGPHLAHYHFDYLNIELFSQGQKMMPDLGYPDAMNAYLPEIHAWSKNTASHNTVVVDAGRQNLNLPGTLHDFADGGFARVMDASAPAYSQISQYRRTAVMVEVSPGQSYVVDLFRVAGGKQHDYMLHGPPGTVATLQGNWSAKAPGTLAGPKVALGELYDGGELAAPGQSAGYAGYQGSGFQYLFNVQQLEEGKALLQYRHVSDTNARLRIHLLEPAPQSVYMADAYDKPRARTHLLKYLVARRTAGPGADLKSSFVSVLEPFGQAPYIRSARLLALSEGEGIAVEVGREGMRDIIISDTGNTRKKLGAYGLESDASTAVVSIDGQGRLIRAFFSGGTYLRCGGREFRAEAIEGKVVSIDARARRITVSLETASAFDPSLLSRKVAHFSNPRRRTVHPLAAARKEGNNLVISTEDDLLVGLVRIGETGKEGASAAGHLPFSATYDGVTLLDGDFNWLGKLKGLKGGILQLAGEPARPLRTGEDVWFSSVGTGDEIRIEPVFSWNSGSVKQGR